MHRGRAAFSCLLALTLSACAPPKAREGSPDGDASVADWPRPDDGDSAGKTPSRWFFAERAYPLGRIPLERWRDAQRLAVARKAEARLRRSTAAWMPRGPTNIGGRLTALAVDPGDDDVVFAAAAEGGVLRSRDGGQSWVALFDSMPTLSIGAITLDPSDSNVVYAGTGEVNPGGGSVAYGGSGLFRSTDQGDTWESLGLELTGAIGRIRVSPTNPDHIFVAAMGHLWQAGPDRGVYRSRDGGQTWQRVLHLDDETGAVDLIQRPDDPDVLYAAMWQRQRRPEYYDYGGPGCSVYRSTDGGDTWVPVSGGLPTPSANGGRIGLSLCAADPDVMYAVYADNVGPFDGLYRSNDGGYTWLRTNDGALDNVFATFGWWFGNVRVHPLDPNVVFVVGFTTRRSTDGGNSWSNVSQNMHVDHHALAFGAGGSPRVYAGNDGGAYRSNDGGSTWTKLADLPITQFYRLALDANNPGALYGGAQDNGTVRTVTGATDDFELIYGGDGFQPLIHPLDSNRIWAQYQYGNLGYTSDDGQSWRDATGGVGGRSNWNSPLVQDPTDPDTRYFGTHRLYRSVDSRNWAAVSGDLTGGAHAGNSGQVDGTLTTIAVSPLDGNTLWTGSDDGHVFVSEDGGGNWTDVSAALPDRWITAVRCDPFDRQTAYVTISGFRWAEPLPHVWRTTDLGATWTAISDGLPDAPANDLLPDPVVAEHYIVATDLGVFHSWDAGRNWSELGQDLPNVVVTQLALDSVNRRLVAATFGRSMFELDLTQVPIADRLHRGTVLTVTGAWRAAALPLDALNDDELNPFPMPVSPPGNADDTLASSDALVLYRLLGADGSPRGNVLRAVRQPAGTVELTF